MIALQRTFVTPVWCAASHGKPEMAEWLLQKGASINGKVLFGLDIECDTTSLCELFAVAAELLRRCAGIFVCGKPSGL